MEYQNEMNDFIKWDIFVLRCMTLNGAIQVDNIFEWILRKWYKSIKRI